MTREEALETLGLYIKNQFLIKHHLAAEAAMRGLADYFLKTKTAQLTLIRGDLSGFYTMQTTS